MQIFGYLIATFGKYNSSFEAWFAQRKTTLEKEIEKEGRRKTWRIKEQQSDWQFILLVHFSWTSDILIAFETLIHIGSLDFDAG